MSIEITTLAERPELVENLYDFSDAWPEFMLHDPIGNSLMGEVHELYADQCVVATEDGELIAHGRSVPFAFPTERRTELPDAGWDRVLTWAHWDQANGVETNVSSAVEILIRPTHLGRGLSSEMLGALRLAVQAKGHRTLYAPVRPNGKTDPNPPMTSYVEQVRADGLPVDPWLRVHVKAGATIVKVAPASMVVPGSLAQWREWTGLPFDADGFVEVPKALVPVHCSLSHDYAVYVEPNVWVKHDLS